MNYLLDFNGCFYCVFKVSHFDSVFFAIFELFDNILFNGNLGYSFFVGFSLVGFAVQFECDLFAFDLFAVDFEGRF